MKSRTKTSQVISKQRVTDHGEVFTAEHEVNAMLDLVHHETLRIESRFLEPACGTGNFLARGLMNDAVYKFKRYEDASLQYIGINRHEDEDIGLYDTVISAREYSETFENAPEI